MEYGILKSALDMGLSIGVFALCVWLVVTIVTKLCGTMEKMEAKMDLFMGKVRDEHAVSIENQKNLQRQHEGMIETLGRINGYKNE